MSVWVRRSRCWLKTPRRASRTTIAALTFVAVLVVAVAVDAITRVTTHPTPISDALSSGSASCPQTSEKPAENYPQRVGQPLLPPDPTVAFLCIYNSSPNELLRQYALSRDTARLVDFINELPESAEIACPMDDDGTPSTSGFLVVVGYAKGFALVRPAGCGILESMGGVRYESGISLFSFWGVTPQNAWPETSP